MIDNTAYVHPQAILCPPYTIGAYAIICANATVLPFTSIPPFFYLPPGAIASPPINSHNAKTLAETISARQVENTIYFLNFYSWGQYPTVTFDTDIDLDIIHTMGFLYFGRNHNINTPVHYTAYARAHTPRTLG